MELMMIWFVEYTSTVKYVEKFGFSLTVTRQFKCEREAVEFAEMLKKDDSNNGTYRDIAIYHC